MSSEPFEIERKFLIRRPSEAWLSANAERSDIEQTYLVRPDGGGRARVRKRSTSLSTIYTHTVKHRVNDLRALELEEEIDEDEYRLLLRQADPKRRTIFKSRYCLPFGGHVFEIDVFPFWPDQALMEIELDCEEQNFAMPEGIDVIREVTADKNYSNASLARQLFEAEQSCSERKE